MATITVHSPSAPVGSAPKDRPVADWVLERPGRTAVFERVGIDYCCHGERPLAAAAAEAGVDADLVLQLLEVFDAGAESAAGAPVATETTAESLDPVALIAHIVATHHAYLYRELPEIQALAAKVAGVHGDRHPELVTIAALVDEVADDLLPHLRQEEEALFPAIVEHVSGAGPEDGTLLPPISVMREEHRVVGEVLGTLRRESASYDVPADACGSYQALYQRLAALEADTFRHIHLENNVLFPAVLTGSTEPQEQNS